MVPGLRANLPYGECRYNNNAETVVGRHSLYNKNLRRNRVVELGNQIGALTLCLSIMAGTTVVYAQVATTLEQAELAGLNPEKRAEVQSRAVNGNTVPEVLQTMLLNSIKLKHPASRIVALDFNRGTAVVELTSGAMTLVPFDTTTLSLKG